MNEIFICNRAASIDEVARFCYMSYSYMRGFWMILMISDERKKSIHRLEKIRGFIQESGVKTETFFQDNCQMWGKCGERINQNAILAI